MEAASTDDQDHDWDSETKLTVQREERRYNPDPPLGMPSQLMTRAEFDDVWGDQADEAWEHSELEEVEGEEDEGETETEESRPPTPRMPAAAFNQQLQDHQMIVGSDSDDEIAEEVAMLHAMKHERQMQEEAELAELEALLASKSAVGAERQARRSKDASAKAAREARLRKLEDVRQRLQDEENAAAAAAAARAARLKARIALHDGDELYDQEDYNAAIQLFKVAPSVRLSPLVHVPSTRNSPSSDHSADSNVDRPAPTLQDALRLKTGDAELTAQIREELKRSVHKERRIALGLDDDATEQEVDEVETDAALAAAHAKDYAALMPLLRQFGLSPSVAAAAPTMSIHV